MYAIHKPIICVKNLPEYSERIINDLFSRFGRILSWRFVNASELHKRDAFVEFDHIQAAFEACNAMNGRIIMNNRLYVDIMHEDHANGHNSRFPEMNNQRISPNGRRDNYIENKEEASSWRISEFANNGQSRHSEVPAHFGVHRHEDRPSNINNFPVRDKPDSNGNIRPFGPKINEIPEDFNNHFHKNNRPNIDNRTNHPMQLQPINHRIPVQQQMGHPGPHQYQANQYKPQPDFISPVKQGQPIMNNNMHNMHNYPMNQYMPPQQQGINNHNGYPRDMEGYNNSSLNYNGPNGRRPMNMPEPQNCITIDSPRNSETVINQVLSQHPEFQAQVNNPGLLKSLVDIVRKEVSALVENKIISHNRDFSRDYQEHSHRGQSPYRASPEHNRHQPNRKRYSRSKSRSRSVDSRRHYSSNKKGYSSSNKKSAYRDSRSRSYSRSRSVSHSRRHHGSPRRVESREDSRTQGHRNRSPGRDHRLNMRYKEKRRERSGSNEHSKTKRNHRRTSRSRSRGRSDQRRRHSRSRSYSREGDRRGSHKEKQHRSNNVSAFDVKERVNQEKRASSSVEEIKGFQAKKGKSSESKEYLLQVGPVTEDQDLSQATTTDSLNILNLVRNNTQENSQGNKEEIKVVEFELKYPYMERHNFTHNYKKHDNKSVKQENTGELRFVYSSRIDENKESNYPFNTDYNWALATVLGVYPDDLSSLNFKENLKGNLERLLEFPQVYSADFYDPSDDECMEKADISNCENIQLDPGLVVADVERKLESLNDNEKEEAIMRMYGIVTKKDIIKTEIPFVQAEAIEKMSLAHEDVSSEEEGEIRVIDAHEFKKKTEKNDIGTFCAYMRKSGTGVV